jgi:hypothetical protein
MLDVCHNVCRRFVFMDAEGESALPSDLDLLSNVIGECGEDWAGAHQAREFPSGIHLVAR